MTALDEALHRANQVPTAEWLRLKALHYGNRTHTTHDGWAFTVFIDAGELDYFDNITAPDGTHLDFNDIPEDHPLSRFFDAIAHLDAAPRGGKP